MALVLRVSLEGRAVGTQTLADGSFVIGRHPDCELVLADPAVSARHARLLVVGEACTVEDLQSTNGTFVNGHRVTRQVLDHGDVLTLGAHRLRFERAGDPPVPARLESEAPPGPARPLEKRVTLLGRRGVQVLAVHRRGDHDRLVVVEAGSGAPPRVNGEPIPAAGHRLADGDLLEFAGRRLRYRRG